MCINRHWIVDVSAVWLAPIQSQHFATAGVGTLDAELATSAESWKESRRQPMTTSHCRHGLPWEFRETVGASWPAIGGSIQAISTPILRTATGEGASSASCFKAETFDLEVTRLLDKRCDGTMLQVSGGVRYAQLQQGADLSFSETGATGYYQTSVLAKNEFSGTGFTLALQGVRPVNCSCFNLFFSVRGSLLFDPHADRLRRHARRLGRRRARPLLSTMLWPTATPTCSLASFKSVDSGTWL